MSKVRGKMYQLKYNSSAFAFKISCRLQNTNSKDVEDFNCVIFLVHYFIIVVVVVIIIIAIILVCDV